LAVLMILSVGLLIYMQLFLRSQYPMEIAKRQRSYRPFIVLVLVLLATVAIARRSPLPPWVSHIHTSNTKPVHVAKKKAKKTVPPAKPEPYRPQFRWLPGVLVGSLILGLGGAMAMSSLRRRGELLIDAPLALVLSDVLAESLDDLRDEPDPRKAVIR